MRSAPAIGFEYRPSRALALLAALLIVLALVAVAVGGIPLWLKVVLETLTVVYGAWSLWRFLRPCVRALSWRSDGSVSIRLTDRHGAETEVQGALHGARVLGPLIALRLRWPHGAASLWLLPDNLDADTRRRLRMRLALDGTQPSVNADSI
jgi:toxin CptA